MISNRVFEDFDILFHNLLNGGSGYGLLKDSKFSVPYNVLVDDNLGLIFEFALVGANVDDIDISVAGDKLTVKYHNNDKPPDKDYTWITKSISKKDFEGSWRIDSKFDVSNIETSYKAGLLRIEVPYSKKLISKKIDIKLLD